MTDTGRFPDEGQPENAGALPGHPLPADAAAPADTGVPTAPPAPAAPTAPSTYAFLENDAADEDDLLLMPGAQGAWMEQPAPQGGTHETGGRDTGSLDYTGVRTPPPGQAPAAAAPPRRPLHMGPPVPDPSNGVVLSLADRGPAAPQQPAGSPQVAGVEYLDAPPVPGADDTAPPAAFVPPQNTGVATQAAPAPAVAHDILAEPQTAPEPEPVSAVAVSAESPAAQSVPGQREPGAAAVAEPQAVPVPAAAPQPQTAAVEPAVPAPAEPQPQPPVGGVAPGAAQAFVDRLVPNLAAQPPAQAPAPTPAPAAPLDPQPEAPVAVEEPLTPAQEAAAVVPPAPVAEEAAVPEPQAVVEQPAPEAPVAEAVEPVAVAAADAPSAPEQHDAAVAPVETPAVDAEQPAPVQAVVEAEPAPAEPEPVPETVPAPAEPVAVAQPAPAPVVEAPVAPAPDQQVPAPAPVVEAPVAEVPVVPAPAVEVPAEAPVEPAPEAPAAEEQPPAPAEEPAPQAAAPEEAAPEATAPEEAAPEEAAPAPAVPAQGVPEQDQAPAPAPVEETPTAQAPAPEPEPEAVPEPVHIHLVPAEPAQEDEAAPAADTTSADEGEAEAAEAEPQPEPEPLGPPAVGYDEAERAAVHRVIRERRDIRKGFRTDPIPHEVLLRVLEAAHTAPSVGHSQPWDFVVIRSEETRRTMHELAARQREAYAKSLPKARAKQFKELKIEAILDTPVNIVVTADPTRGGRHTLGRHTQPQMAPYSSALAVENLWLAARAEGLGVGWVSFFDEREMVRALGLPEHLEVVAYLCIGYVDEFPDEPELMQAGWSKRRPLSWVVHEEEYGRRALPGEDPHDLLAETLRGIRPLDAKALGEAWERQKRMTKPSGALGMLEIISAQLCGLSRKCPPPIPEPAAVAIFAGDHGVHAQGVTAWPQEVTSQMVANFLGGGAVCNAFANQVGAEVCVVDVGVAAELPSTPGLLPRKIRPGTADFTTGPAMTREEALQALEVGIETARDLVTAGNKALLTGEMGIANTTVSAALISVFTGADPAEITGRGTGINDEMHARKIDVVRRALELHKPDPKDPIGVLAAIGGLEHAALVGLILGGASLRTPVILDGVSAGAAALVARAIAPEALAACVAGHRSAEPGHVAALTKLGLRPLVDLDLRLGEGTGALLALPIVQSAARAMHEVATFDAAGVAEKS
ncbi:nicotinate-nucleotide--dimethylbenzimidazole phosphoribosyltransferase [Streptomyces sp. NPDC053079]|uniref:nicotinate-nucleotide--dimethylbenzimidazole phosphoribosyltransferase n=1 Tax=Streptomyces sp. NPDC053079 TaxID=3365697 RepID=UPI0037D886C7